MPDVTIAETITNLRWQGGDAPTLIIEASDGQMTPEGVPVNGGGPFREEYETEVDEDGYVVVPDVILPSGVTYFAYFQKANVYDSGSRIPFSVFGPQRSFYVPEDTPTTWEEIDAARGGTLPTVSGDRTVDNLTVNNDATVGGDIDADGTVTAPEFVGNITGATGDFSGIVNAQAFVGNGAGLTGIGSGTGGVINTGSTTIGADSDANGVGKISLQIGGVEIASIENGGSPRGFTSAVKVYTSLNGAAHDGVTDDAAAIQALLDLAPALGCVHVVIDGVALSSPLDIHGNTTLEILAGCSLKLKNGSNRALLRNANPTIGTIVDENITLIGGTYDGNSVNQTGTGTFSTQEADGPLGAPGTLIGCIQIYGVRHLKIRGVHVMHSKTIAVHVSNAVDVDVRDLSFDNKVVGQVQQGGLQFDGPFSQITVDGLRGQTEDDMLALNTNDADWAGGLGPYVTNGDGVDVAASNIVADGCNYVLRTFNGANRLDRVRVSNITGTVNMRVWHNDPLTIGPGNVGTFSVEGVDVDAATAPFAGAAFFDIHLRAERLVFRSINIRNTVDSRPVIRINPSAVIGWLDTDFCFTDTSTGAAGCIPVEIEGKVKRLTGRMDWDRASSLAQATDFIKFTAATGLVEDLDVDIKANKCTYLINHDAGALYGVRLRSVRQLEGAGGLALRGVAGIVDDLLVSNWYGDNCAPYAVAALGAVTRRRGDAFPPDTTAPIYSGGTAFGTYPVVSVTFSESINARDYAAGVTIKKNTVTQTIVSAKRREGRPTIVDFVLSANISGGDTVTWEYAVASGNYADWSNNPLANVSAQTVAVAGTGYTFDQFTAAHGTALSARTPSPLTTSGNAWAILRGTSGKQTIQSNRAQLDSLLAVQALTVNSTAANVLIRVVVRALAPYNDSANNAFGVLFRVTDANNYWLYWLSPNAATLFKVVAGVATPVTEPIPHIENRDYELIVSANGSGITCAAGGGEILSATDSFNSTAVDHGLQASGCKALFEDFSVVSV